MNYLLNTSNFIVKRFSHHHSNNFYETYNIELFYIKLKDTNLKLIELKDELKDNNLKLINFENKLNELKDELKKVKKELNNINKTKK